MSVSLEPMKLALKKSGLLSRIDEKKVIVVAGTNGKGSVCATLEALLLSAGKRVGLYTSPHLIKPTERFRINGVDISEEVFVKALSATENISKELELNHFQALTFMAAWIYFSGNAGDFDYVILEVGIGGTFDATNAIPHKNCIISVLGMDHEDLLGNNIVSIAKNKFGIVSHNCQVVHAPLDLQVRKLAKDIQQETQSNWIERIDFSSSSGIKNSEPEFYIHSEYSNNEPVKLNLPGYRGAENTALALTAFNALGFDCSKHMHALSNVRWGGRMEKLEIQNAPCSVYASGDHNPQGVVSLLEILKYYPRQHLHLVVGIGKDKNAHVILDMLTSLPDTHLYLTETPFKGLTLAQYGPWLQRAIYANENPEEALRAALGAASTGDLVLVTGSLYLVGEIKKLF